MWFLLIYWLMVEMIFLVLVLLLLIGFLSISWCGVVSVLFRVRFL